MVSRVVLLGEPALYIDGRSVKFPVKALVAAAYLATDAGGFQATRARIAELLWDATRTDSLNGNLRQLLLRVREAQARIGCEVLTEVDGRIRLATDGIEIDVLELEESPARPLSTETLRHLCGSELLTGVEMEGDVGRQWLSSARNKIRDKLLETLLERAEGEATPAERRNLRDAAVSLIEADPYRETAYRVLIRILADEHQFSQVREVFARCRSRLREELGIEPDETTLELVRSIFRQGRSGQAGPAVPASVRAHPPLEPHGSSSAILLPRVAVMPPELAPSAGEAGHVATALLEDVTLGLCSARSVSMVAPHTCQRLAQESVDTIAQLGIDYSVESRLVRFGETASLQVKLVDAASRTIIWAERYGVDALDAHGSYRDLSARIGTSVIETVERTELDKLLPEHDGSAYCLFLKGRFHLRQMDLPSIRKARKCFKAATKESPVYASAIAGIARTYHLEWLLLARGDASCLEQAGEYARQAAELSPTEVHALRELGLWNQFSGRFEASLQAFDEAELVSPHYADLLADHADALVHASEPELALRKIHQATALNPLCPDDYRWIEGGANFLLGNYREAIEALQRMRERGPAYRLMAASSAMAGDMEASRQYARKARAIHPDFRVEDWLAVLPLRDPRQRDHYEEGLRRAGFK
ncbi:BTAD domain-containing putative transcriptional regulator [Chthonobacter albigriseus]|uniref:BTAD domain-containing putative transcriptional regulator n=1 Tax=Chthonobacter albigriseus TaxID=1683161 RepID=UPI0015EEEF20|nr:BTAD domain-containing putative transcriptional regulator [Chthonobacter albigriseus]